MATTIPLHPLNDGRRGGVRISDAFGPHSSRLDAPRGMLAARTADELMKIYLDDQRPAPTGWTLARTADDAIGLLRGGHATDLSLDYDLGDPHFGTGLDVLEWLEQAVGEGRVRLPRLTAHSGSILGRRRLEAAIALLEERFR